MKCPRCGSGKTQFVGDVGPWRRYHCNECQNTFTDQAREMPPHRQIHPDELPERRDR